MSLELPILKTLYPVSNYLPGLKANLEARTINPEMPINSIPALNERLWGFRKRKFYIIAARPSIGKSAFALQMAYDLALQGKRVLFLSLEMTVEDILERIFCYEHKIDNQELDRGNFVKHSANFDIFCERINQTNLVLSDCIGKDWQDIEGIISVMTVKPDIIFIDHLNAIRSSGFNSKFEIDQYINNLCTLAKQHNISVVLCCQLNRDNQKDDDKTPQLHELKGSGNLEEMADVVIMLHWPFKYKKSGDTKIKKNDFVVIIGKNRNGPTGYIDLHFRPEHYTYSDGYKPIVEPKKPAKEVQNVIKEDEIAWE